MALLETTVEGGRVHGVPGRNQSVSVFRGIPYARAERWSAPEPATPWEGTRDAARYGAICPQRRFDFEGGMTLAATEFYVVDYPMSEDCLVVNVWTPAASADERLPVAVYIHGGAYETGYGWLNAYDGEGFNRRGVVLVTVNYRVNVFGYLSLPELAAEDAHGSTGCYGLLDQLAALDWVRRNITAFGGDPDHITLFGQSAGGGSVSNVLNSPFGQGKLRAAIMQSGGALAFEGDLAPLDRETADAAGREFMAIAGASSVAELRTLNAAALVAAHQELSRRHPIPMRPTIDGYALTHSPVEWFGEGRHDDIPTIVGSTADEMRRAPGGPDPVGDAMRAAALSWCENQNRLGYTAPYSYFFDYVPPTAGMAHHSVEHHYVFETLNGSPRPYTAQDYDLALDLAGYWASFATTGDPNGLKFPHGSEERLPQWSPYTGPDPRSLLIAGGPHMGEAPVSDAVADIVRATVAAADRAAGRRQP